MQNEDGRLYALSVEEEQLARLPVPVLEDALEFYERLPSKVVDLQPYSRQDPRDFIRDVLGHEMTQAARDAGMQEPWTKELDALFVSARDIKRTVVYSGNSTGKTWGFARIALWFLFRYPKSRVVTTAPTMRQVRDVLWGELRHAFRTSRTPLPGRLLTTELQVDDLWSAVGFTARISVSDTSASGFQGIHGPYVLVLIDEGAGVDRQVFEAAERCATGPDDRIVVGGNPTAPQSKYAELGLYRTAENKPLYRKIVINGELHPNVVHDNPGIIPGAVTREFIEARLAETGSVDSGLYRSSVLGLFPTEAKDALISMAWITAAQHYADDVEEQKREGKFERDRRGVGLGLDIASEGEDLTVLMAMEDGVLFMPKINDKPAWHRGRDVMHAVDLVMSALGTIPNVRSLALDDTGLGSGVTARLRQLQKEGKIPRYTTIRNDVMRTQPVLILPIVMNSIPINNTRFVYRKDELWWTLREALREGAMKGSKKRIALPPEARMAEWTLPRGHNLVAQLTVPTYDNEMRGKISVYDKRGAHGKVEKTKNLPAISPDVAHATLLAHEAWRRLAAEVRVLPRTQKEVFAEQIKKLARGTAAPLKGRMPWQVRG